MNTPDAITPSSATEHIQANQIQADQPQPDHSRLDQGAGEPPRESPASILFNDFVPPGKLHSPDLARLLQAYLV
ncbi:MAG: hypothetical protein K0Q67_312, partial [Cellvibrio sp.]|nr:hypothetical protein [Cellvibrio sp.]